MHNASVEQIRDFTSSYGSFLCNQYGEDIYYMRGWTDENGICLQQDWFNVLCKKLFFAKIGEIKITNNKMTFDYIIYEGKRRNVSEVTITGYDPVCDINNKKFPFKNIYCFETIIRNADWLVDEDLSGVKDGTIYCVLDLFRLGSLDYNEVKGTELIGFFERDFKAGKLHIPQFDDTLTIYRACNENDSKNNWYGLWSMTKQSPLNRLEFEDEKFSENFSKKVLTNVRL